MTEIERRDNGLPVRIERASETPEASTTLIPENNDFGQALRTVNPNGKVELVVVRDGLIEIELSEEVDLTSASSVITVAGAGSTWSLGEDRYTLASDSALTVGDHELRIGVDPLDLAGRGPASEFVSTISVDPEQPEKILYRAPDPRLVDKTTVGNVFAFQAFQGLQKDAETGLLYVRNRYLDPELGRFISADPLGFVDAPSMYQFAGYSLFNASHPFGPEVQVCSRPVEILRI